MDPQGRGRGRGRGMPPPVQGIGLGQEEKEVEGVGGLLPPSPTSPGAGGGRGRGRGRAVCRGVDVRPDEGLNKEEETVEQVGRSRKGSDESKEGSRPETPVEPLGRGRGRARAVIRHEGPVEVEQLPVEVELPYPVPGQFEPVEQERQTEITVEQDVPRTTSTPTVATDSMVGSMSAMRIGDYSGGQSQTQPPGSQLQRTEAASALSGGQSRAPSVSVTAPLPAEEVMQKSTRLQRVKIERHGEKGEQTSVATNFIRLTYINDGKIMEYHVDFDPIIDGTRLRRKLMEIALGDETHNFDGTMLFFPEFKGNLVVYNVKNPNSGEMVKLTCKYVKEKEPNDLIQFFNILFKKIMLKLNRVLLKRSYFDVSNVTKIPQHKIEVWPGYCIGVEEQEGGLMICVDVTHRVLRQDTVLDQLKVYKEVGVDWQKKFTNFIINKIVLTRYNNQCYKVDDVRFDASPRDTFTKNGKEVSYIQYYKEHHTIDVEEFDQPLLMSNLKPKRAPQLPDKWVCLLPELCHVTGLTDDLRSNFHVMKDLGNHTRLNPAQRKASLEKFLSQINDNPGVRAILTEWNLELSKTPLHMDARIHGRPKLDFGRQQVVVGADFGREATASVVKPVAVPKYLLLSTARDSNLAKEFATTYFRVCGQLGIPCVGNPDIIPLRGQSVIDFREGIEKNLKPDHKLIVVVMPQQRDDLYSMIKKTCVAKLEIPSQCVLTKTLSNQKRFKSVIQKIALQINCKLGGALWALKLPLQDQPYMFLGIDVAHDALKKSSSVLGLVSSLNTECTKFVSITRELGTHEEFSSTMTNGFSEILQCFRQERGCFPTRIFVWRDGGTADPQTFNMVEAQQLKKAIKNVCDEATQFTFVVVKKRIPQRFFKTDRTGRNWENPDPGTVIDHTVTTFDAYDFYVVSQLVRQGAVTPTHYTVIEDTGNVKPDLIQKFAYTLSFMYYNWPGTIRIPAMTQYAHKLAGLVQANVRATPKKGMEKYLYFL